MNDLVRCDSCSGTKRIMGMGGMMKPCPVCNAVGWVDGTEKIRIDISNLKNLNGEPVKAKKKPGPQKGWKTNNKNNHAAVE